MTNSYLTGKPPAELSSVQEQLDAALQFNHLGHQVVLSAPLVADCAACGKPILGGGVRISHPVATSDYHTSCLSSRQLNTK